MLRLTCLFTLFSIILLFNGITIHAQSQKLTYICPLPGSQYLNPEQNIIIKAIKPFDPASAARAEIHIIGSKSRHKNLSSVCSSDGKTLIFKPSRPFELGERVEVIISGLRTIDGEAIEPESFHFFIKERQVGEIRLDDECHVMMATSGIVPHPQTSGMETKGRDNNLPPDFPSPIEVTGSYISDEYIFTNFNGRASFGTYSDYRVILDNFGTPIYYQETPVNEINFCVLPNGMLTFGRNYQTHTPLERFYLLDSSYVIIDSVNTGNGYYIDSHDMLLMENGHFLAMSYDPQYVNMSLVVPGGNPNAVVIGLVIQEVDLEENVYFQWRSWDHYEITDATSDINLLAAEIDYVHGNALEIDNDGHIMVSCRHMDEITKINYNTGEIIWRFGKNAINNQFTIHNDPIGFSHQHDIRKAPNGTYTLYDNGNLHSPPISRGLEYIINETSMDAILVGTYQHIPSIYASLTGSFRRLHDGRKVIGWGGTNAAQLYTELNPDNTVSLEIMPPAVITSYRAIKTKWQTNLFTAVGDLSFGNFYGYDDPKALKIYVHNNSGNSIKITSSHNHLDAFEVTTPLPVSIFPNSSREISIAFNPSIEGEFVDVLTLNYDNPENTRRIARQLVLSGVLDEDLPTVFFDPENGTSGVDPGADLRVLFSEPVRKKGGDEITSQDIPDIIMLKETDQEGNPVAFTGEINEDKTVMTIIPDEALDDEQQYYIELVGDKLEDHEGNVIEFGEASFFITGSSVGLEGRLQEREFYIAPNPVREQLSIHFTSKSKWIAELTSLAGKILFRKKTEGAHITFPTTSLSRGIYIMAIYDQHTGRRWTEKIVICGL